MFKPWVSIMNNDNLGLSKIFVTHIYFHVKQGTIYIDDCMMFVKLTFEICQLWTGNIIHFGRPERGELEPPSFGFMPIALPFELLGTGLFYPIFWNAGSGGINIFILDSPCSSVRDSGRCPDDNTHFIHRISYIFGTCITLGKDRGWVWISKGYLFKHIRIMTDHMTYAFLAFMQSIFQREPWNLAC